MQNKMLTYPKSTTLPPPKHSHYTSTHIHHHISSQLLPYTTLFRSHHSIQTTFWEVQQVPTTQSLTITSYHHKIIPSLKQINLVLCYIYCTNKSYVRCKIKC